MNTRQKNIVRNFIFVIAITLAAVVAMIHFRDYVNRKEAMLAMRQFGAVVMKYRQDHGSVPAKFQLDGIKKKIEGGARLGIISYRARWIEFGASDDEILAYTPKNYSGLIFGDGYIVLRLDGKVEWMKKNEFDKLLDSQQSQEEQKLGDEQL